jgi:hypothetical protein
MSEVMKTTEIVEKFSKIAQAQGLKSGTPIKVIIGQETVIDVEVPKDYIFIGNIGVDGVLKKANG